MCFYKLKSAILLNVAKFNLRTLTKQKIIIYYQQIWVLKEPRSQEKIKIFLVIKGIIGIPHYKEIRSIHCLEMGQASKKENKNRDGYTQIYNLREKLKTQVRFHLERKFYSR